MNSHFVRLLWSINAVVMATLVFFDAAEAQVQTVPVRTGEHAGFTRIVIDFSERPGWRLGRNAGRYELWLDDPEIGFGLSDAFRRLQGRRVVGLRDLGAGRLAIELTCECALSVDQLPNQGLLIDVQDEKPSPKNLWANALVAQPELTWMDDSSSIPVLPLILPEMRQGLNLLSLESKSSDELDYAALKRIQDLQTDLLEQTARAASQGLITLETVGTERAPRPLLGQSERDRKYLPVLPSPPLAANIRIETQYDRDSRSSQPGPIQEQKFECFPPQLVDVGDWFFDASVLDQLGQARTNLVDARDRPDPKAYATLARMLIYLTFGREAEAVLEQAPEAMADRELLLELAKVIDSGAQSGLVAIQTQTSCDTTGALWGLLARSDTMPSDQLNAFAVVRHFSAFPTHLRHHLGPPIAEKLMDMGEYESALQVRNAILRGSQGDGPQMMMLQARIDQMDGNEPEANRNFAAVAISRSEQAALALTQLIENEVTADKIISDDLLDQAMALVSEFDVSATAFSLPKAIIAALVQQLKFQEAFGQINEFRERGQLDEEMAQVLWARSLEKLITDADDVTFMTNAVTQMRADAVDDPVRLAIAARLVELQLPGPARVALGTRADIPSDQERYILAKIAILEGKRSVAMSYLTGLNSDQAISLRILADEITISDQQLEIAGDDIAASFEPSRPQEVSDVVSEGTLARSQQLIDQTKEMRDSLLVLLREQQN